MANSVCPEGTSRKSLKFSVVWLAGRDEELVGQIENVG